MSTTESVLLDTSIIVAHFRHEPALAEQLKSSTLYIPLPVLGELYYGAFKSTHKAKTLRQLNEFLLICAILPPDELTAQHYGSVKADLEQAGSRIPENDLWIAAIAREHQLPLVTRDQHFSRITELKTLAW
jgi:Predicted nucleic acid-binding protein, contains PIN domain